MKYVDDSFLSNVEELQIPSSAEFIKQVYKRLRTLDKGPIIVILFQLLHIFNTFFMQQYVMAFLVRINIII